MARTPEQVLREIIAENVFRIAVLTSENEKLKEDVAKVSDDAKNLIDATVRQMEREE